MDHVVDWIDWLLNHRNMVGGLQFIQEPPVLRFFTGRLKAINDWGAKLAVAFEAEFGLNA